MMPSSVRVLQSGTDLLPKRYHFFPSEPAAALEHPFERLALDVLHDVERGLPIAAGGVKANDVRMVQGLEDRGFALEAGEGRRVGVEPRRDDLDGDFLAGLRVAGLVDGAHRAGADFFVDGERPKFLPDQHRRLRKVIQASAPRRGRSRSGSCRPLPA